MSEEAGQLVAHIPRLRRYARALVGDPEAADDLVQDTLERALTRLNRFRPGTDLRAWLFTIMHNLYVSALRRYHRRPLHHAFEEGREGVPGGQEDSLRLDELEAALARLPSAQREVLLLVVLEGMRYEEVAAVLEIPLGTVMSRLYRARERLRRLLEGGAGPRLRRVK
ncbi:sigma-70 family RNA polymerase sigma factor [Inmirania thermothiophila]|uniref:RNA polymerase sigma-70 factor (ECF subfamily) n=1 Tax=Inmirania thermothiophila TaxID=1750597 RepID=A0A3N1Y813_9GAMM|nr:sigma-70 family RNA polymerase sigma factor [Inmirania thermothiophila]ROR34651.1 RNA polymerase sigma-70 factor (ECF subfamily) [Inmirania thermothiophila]